MQPEVGSHTYEGDLSHYVTLYQKNSSIHPFRNGFFYIGPSYNVNTTLVIYKSVIISKIKQYI
jgi:hypothetical protein